MRSYEQHLKDLLISNELIKMNQWQLPGSLGETLWKNEMKRWRWGGGGGGWKKPGIVSTILLLHSCEVLASGSSLQRKTYPTHQSGPDYIPPSCANRGTWRAARRSPCAAVPALKATICFPHFASLHCTVRAGHTEKTQT